MLDGHAQFGKPLEHRHHFVRKKGRLAIEDVQLGIGRFGMHEKRHPELGHRLEHRCELEEGRASGLGVGRRPRRVELHPYDDATLPRRPHLLGAERGGEVQRHQGLEVGSVDGDRFQDPLPIIQGLIERDDRRGQVRHDQSAAEPCRSVVDDGVEHFVVAQMHVPVVRDRDRDVDLIAGHAHRRSGSR